MNRLLILRLDWSIFWMVRSVEKRLVLRWMSICARWGVGVKGGGESNKVFCFLLFLFVAFSQL